MKKYLCIAALLAVSLSLAACGETGESTTAETTKGAAETTTTTAATEATTTTEVTTTTEATTTEATTTEEVVEISEAEEELYTVEECLTKIIEEEFGQTVDSIYFNTENPDSIAINIVDGDEVLYYEYTLYSTTLCKKNCTGEKVSRKNFNIDLSADKESSIEYIAEEPVDTLFDFSPKPDNPDGKYPLIECYRRYLENELGYKIVEIQDHTKEENKSCPIAITDSGERILLGVNIEYYYTDEPVTYDNINFSELFEMEDGGYYIGSTFDP